MRAAVGVIALSACLVVGCGRAREAPVIAATNAASTPAAGTIPHGDHNPRHGGLVFMDGDLHVEVVLARSGAHRLYFSDAVREELPAATASVVTLTITRKSGQPEVVALQIDDAGESWGGRGREVVDADATARIAYTAHGKPYFIDVPFPH